MAERRADRGTITGPLTAAGDFVIVVDVSDTTDHATGTDKKQTRAEFNLFVDDDVLERWMPMVYPALSIVTAITYDSNDVIAGGTINWPGATVGTLTITGTDATSGAVTTFTATYPDYLGGERTITGTITYNADDWVTQIVYTFA